MWNVVKICQSVRELCLMLYPERQTNKPSNRHTFQNDFFPSNDGLYRFNLGILVDQGVAKYTDTNSCYDFNVSVGFVQIIWLRSRLLCAFPCCKLDDNQCEVGNSLWLLWYKPRWLGFCSMVTFDLHLEGRRGHQGLFEWLWHGPGKQQGLR